MTDSDVAREAGVSRATVYYVLNDDPKRRIPDVTRQRVTDAVERLGYVPFGPARLLRGGRSSVVLLLTHGLQHATDLVATSIVTRLGRALEDRGLHLIWQLDSEETRDPSIDLAPTVVLSSARRDEHPFEVATAEYTVPVLEAFPGLDGFISGAAREQVRHLMSRGRTHLAYAAPSSDELSATAEMRWDAVVASAAEHGLAAPVRFDVPADRGAVGAALLTMLERHPELDAVCAFNDECAFALLAGAHDVGVAVPQRLAVIGVDDHPFGPFAVPALTTVTTEVSDFIEALAERIVAAGQGESVDGVALPEQASTIPRSST